MAILPDVIVCSLAPITCAVKTSVYIRMHYSPRAQTEINPPPKGWIREPGGLRWAAEELLWFSRRNIASREDNVWEDFPGARPAHHNEQVLTTPGNVSHTLSSREPIFLLENQSSSPAAPR
eukprot:3952165-Pyramimonas_sp.AAC.1